METLEDLVYETLECITDYEEQEEKIDKVANAILKDSEFYQAIRDLIIEQSDYYIDRVD